MELTRRQELVFGGIVFFLAAILILARLNSFGIWDPSELTIAEAASRLASGKEVRSHIGFSTYLVALSFDLLGKSDWAGRLPFAFSGLMLVAIAYFLVRRYAGPRAGVYAALIAVTTPLVLFNARSMLGDAPALVAQACVALCAVSAVLGDPAGAKRSWTATGAWVVATALATWLAIEIRGALLGALPPLLAVSTLAVMRGYPWRFAGSAQRAVASLLVAGGTALLIAFVAAALSQGGLTEYSSWVGIASLQLKYPEFDRMIESIFHAFAPWSALLPVALAYLFAPAAVQSSPSNQAEGGDRACSNTGEPEQAPPSSAVQADGLFQESTLRRITALWIFFGYGAHTLYLSLGGEPAAFIPVVALAAAVALLLRSIERGNDALLAAAVVTALLAGLIIRDYALYPGSPLKAMPQGNITIPQVFNPKKYWAAILAIFAVASFFAFGVASNRSGLEWTAPYRLLRKQWKRGLPYKTWLSVIALVFTGLMALSLLTFVAPSTLHITTIATKWIRRLSLVPVALPFAVGLIQVALYAAGRLKNLRLVPLLSVGVCFGAGVSQIYLPQLSTHLSPRAVYETYSKFARPSDELIEYRMGIRTATYYLSGKAREIVRQSDLLDYLLAKSRRWAVLPPTELGVIDGEFRKRSGRHLFVVDARSARAVLVTNQPLGGQEDQNSVAKYVLKTPPKIEYKVGARFGQYLDLIGYNLKLPHGDFVGAGESFTITWYYRVLKRMPGGYKVFVHIDGYGLRLNGDHDPMDGAYAMRLWEKDDVIVDEQPLQVPAHFRSGHYTIFMGYFSGDERLPVVQGPHDDGNRVNAGTLRVR